MNGDTDAAHQVPGKALEHWRSATVLVTGATGFLGGSLARHLLARGAHVRVLARSPSRARPLADMGAEVVIGDVTDQAAVEGAVDCVQVVYHLAGRLFAPGVEPGAYKRVHVDGTAVLLGCCARARKVTRFVHCSTTGVLGATGDRPAPEDAPIRPGNAYEATKAESEQLVRIACSNGLPAVIARPGLVYGPGDLHLVPFFASVLRRRFRPIGRNPVWLHPIYIDDLTEALLTCGSSEWALGECFNLAGRQPVTLAELARAVGLAGGVRPTSGFIPLYIARAAAKVGDLLPPALRATAPLTTSRLDFLTHSRVYDVTKAARVLGFTAATDLTDGMAKTFAWYGSNGYLPRSASSERLPLPVTSTSTGPSTCGKNATKPTWPAAVTASRSPHDQLTSAGPYTQRSNLDNIPKRWLLSRIITRTRISESKFVIRI